MALAGLKVVFHTPTLISLEFKANALSAYFGRESRPLLVFFVFFSNYCKQCLSALISTRVVAL